jgi:hypothetical protein
VGSNPTVTAISINMNTTTLFLNALIKKVRHGFSEAPALDGADRIAEFRTCMMGLPRRSGKTSAIIELVQQHPSVVLAAKDRLAHDLVARLGRRVISVDLLGGVQRPLIMSTLQPGIELILVDEGLTLNAEGRRLVSEFAYGLLLKKIADPDKLVVLHVGT